MWTTRRLIFWQGIAKRLIASVTLLAYLAAAFGLPLPVAAAVKDSKQPYPCMNNPCGCACAEDCWRHCCCTTPAERWAWAEAHHIQPPDYAERPTVDDPGNISTPEYASGGSSHNACTHCHQGETGRSTAANSPGVLVASALRCKGLATLWVSSGTIPAPGATFSWRPVLVLCDHFAISDRLGARLTQTPPAPPPR